MTTRLGGWSTNLTLDYSTFSDPFCSGISHVLGNEQALRRQGVEALRMVRLDWPTVGRHWPAKRKTKGKYMKRQLQTIGAIAMGCLLVLGASSLTASPKEGNPNPGIAPPNSQPLGASYDNWVVMALQYYYSVPMAEWPPTTRVVGNMVMPPVAQATGVTLPVTMQVGQWFLLPLSFAAWANAPGDWGYDHPWSEPYEGYPTYEAWAREMTKEYGDQWRPVATIDGKLVQNIDLYRMQTSLFDLTVPEDNAWDWAGYDLPAGTYGPSFGDGWWAILNPMTPGKHTITTTVGEGLFVSYEITVTTGRGK
jgi:hypothetical protein